MCNDPNCEVCCEIFPSAEENKEIYGKPVWMSVAQWVKWKKHQKHAKNIEKSVIMVDEAEIFPSTEEFRGFKVAVSDYDRYTIQDECRDIQCQCGEG